MTDDREKDLRKYLGYAKALMDAMELSIHGQEHDVWRFSSYQEYMERYDDLLSTINAKSFNLDVSGLKYFVVGEIPRSTDTIAIQQKQYFDSVYTNLAILRSYIENALDLKKDETLSLKDFFQANLRKAVMGIPRNEIDIQNAVETLLIGRGLDKGIGYDRETGRIKVSIKEFVPDFVIKSLNMALEVKFSKDKASSKRIVDEINADIRAYSNKYARQLFIVYDMGSIDNEDEFKKGLDNAEDILVIIVKQ